MPALDQAVASQLARIALGHVTAEYPHKADLVLLDAADLRPARDLHPIFYGSFDWHSCVHSYWLLATIADGFPDIAERAAIAALFESSLTPRKVAVEQAYFEQAHTATFERPYGWAWLLALHAALSSGQFTAQAEALAPLARRIAGSFDGYFEKLTLPIRSGVHSNTAFAATLALDWARRHDSALAERLCAWAVARFGGDRVLQIWEPGGEDFLSPTLCAGVLMARVLAPEAAGTWLLHYLPGLAAGEPAALFQPAAVSDRNDYRIAHLDGLNLSRVWAWREIAARLTGAPAARAREAAERHLSAGLDHIDGHYAGRHWLATYALLALQEP
jgi:hypothetical protein